MLVYWLVWISIVVLAILCEKYDLEMSQELTTIKVNHSGTAKRFFVIASVILIMVAGCRYYVGTDFGGYYRLYSSYLDFIPSLKSLDEPGIRLVYSIAVRIHDTGGMCILSVAAVTLGLELFVIYRNTDNIGFALALFVFICWSACFNGVRQALAAAVLFLGLPFLRDKKFWKYAIIVLLAFLCHRSAIVMILIYFIVNREVNTKNVILLIIASVIVLISYDKVYDVVNVVMDEKLTGQEEYWNTQVNVLRVLTSVAPAVFFLFLYRSEEKTPQINFYLNLLLIHAVVSVVTANSACLYRMVMYTIPFSVIAMAELIKLQPLKSRKLYGPIIIVLFWAMQLYECSMSTTLNNFQLRWFW